MITFISQPLNDKTLLSASSDYAEKLKFALKRIRPLEFVSRKLLRVSWKQFLRILKMETFKPGCIPSVLVKSNRSPLRENWRHHVNCWSPSVLFNGVKQRFCATRQTNREARTANAIVAPRTLSHYRTNRNPRFESSGTEPFHYRNDFHSDHCVCSVINITRQASRPNQK